MTDTYKPTAEMAAAGKRALRWVADGHAGSGFTDVGRRRAAQLANRENLSLETVKRMHSFFSRHEVDKKGKDFDNLSKPSPGRVAWDAWGGDAGQTWAKRIVESMTDKAANVIDASAFFGIVKADKQADGTILVTGLATDDSLDVDEQICDPDWLKAAMPDWFQWGNIREQHSNIAAGVATEYEAKGAQHIITARIVDPASVKKVETGVLKGFSVGIRNARVVKDAGAPGGRIVDGQIVEVSIVDRPANPNCTLTVAKAIDGEITRVEELTETSEVHKMAEETTSEESTEESTKMKAAEETTAPNKDGEGSNPESTEETTAMKAAEETTSEAIRAEETKMCKECGKAMADCKCAEGGYSATEKAAEESSQKPGEESSQKLGEESSRPGGVAGIAGKSIEDVLDKLRELAETVTLLKNTYGELLEKFTTTEDIAKSVQEVAERVSVVEKAPAGAPMRMAVGNKPVTEVNPSVTKAAEYRAKAAAASDPTLVKGYLALAHELESTNL